MISRSDGRPSREPAGRARRLDDYLRALDPGEIVTGRILQLLGGETVRVALGPGVVTARAVGGRPEVGSCRLEVLTTGERPVLRILGLAEAGRTEIRVDVSREKRRSLVGGRVDRRA